MALSNVVKIARSALEMERARMELISSNLANARTTRTPEGGPYLRRLPVIEAAPLDRPSFSDLLADSTKGVRVAEVVTDEKPPVMRYEPGHPDANADGYVAYPNVDPVEEMVDMLSAVRSYEANVNVVKTVGKMHEAAMRISR